MKIVFNGEHHTGVKVSKCLLEIPDSASWEDVEEFLGHVTSMLKEDYSDLKNGLEL